MRRRSGSARTRRTPAAPVCSRRARTARRWPSRRCCGCSTGTVCAPFFVPGRVAERYPDRVRDILAAGHEVGHHGYTHTSPMSLTAHAEEEAGTRGARPRRARRGRRRVPLPVRGSSARSRCHCWRSTDSLLLQHDGRHPAVPAGGSRPRRAPGALGARRRTALLVRRRVVEQEHPHATRGARLWQGEIAGIREMGGLAMLTTHPQIIGRPGRIGMLDELLGRVLTRAGSG